MLRPVLNELKAVFQALYGERLERLIVFGSQARGDASAESDIDVLVVLRSEVRPGQEIARASPITSAISLAHDVVISCVFVSLERYAHEQSPLLMNVRREGIAL